MKSRKKKLLVAIIGIILVFGSLICNRIIKEEKSLLPNSHTSNNNIIAVYMEDADSETGYSKSDETMFPSEGYILNLEKSTCTNGGVLSQDSSTKKVSLSVGYKSNCSLYFDKEISKASDILAGKIINAKSSDTLNFGNAATTDETADGLYFMEDDYGTSYYYRGAVEDNYVKFAGFYWRIIRVNGDGSLRIIYDGTNAHRNGEANEDRLALTNLDWNSIFNDAKYAGYMFEGSNGSASMSKEQAQTNETNTNIKTQLENWYKTNIVDKGYDNYVSDNIFCNDRSTPGKSVTSWSSDTGLGYGINVTGYGALSRMMTGSGTALLYAKGSPKPKFTCENKNDAFTKSDTNKGNGKLEQKVGIITADEIVAGGSGQYITANSNYYLNKGFVFWSLSPAYFRGSAFMFAVTTNGALINNSINNMSGVAPVISLTSEFVNTLIGSGTMSNPFRDVEN